MLLASISTLVAPEDLPRPGTDGWHWCLRKGRNLVVLVTFPEQVPEEAGVGDSVGSLPVY